MSVLENDFSPGLASSDYVHHSLITNFDDRLEASLWHIVNDDVMGGCSNSQFYIDQNLGVFTGQLSLKNNGGFASVFRKWPRQLTQGTKIGINIEGDGRGYQLRLRTKMLGNGLSYKVDFETKANHHQYFEYSLEDFIGTFRGREIHDAPRILCSEIEEIGFLLANKQEGTFKLSVESILLIPKR